MEDGAEDKITTRIIQAATKKVFDSHHDLQDLAPVIAAFNEGLSIEIGEAVYVDDYATIIDKIPGMADRLSANTPGTRASEVEFILKACI